PNVNVYYQAQGSGSWGYGADSVAGSPTDTPWLPDTAHQPDLTYEAYLTTGSRYYLDELQSQADWALIHMPPDYRDYSDGNLMTHGELRAQAWDLRELGETAYISPDADPLKGYFSTAVENNLNWLVDTYVTHNALGQAGAVEGWLPGYPDGGL